MGEGRSRGGRGREIERFISAQKPRWLVSYYLQEGDISNSGEKEINTAATKSIQNSKTIIIMSFDSCSLYISPGYRR